MPLRKGQVGFESLVLVSVVVLIYLYVFVTYSSREIEVKWSDQFLAAKRECHIISSLINRVRANEKNFAERLSVPKDYNIKIFGDLRGLEVWWGNDFVYCTFSTVNVTNGTHPRFDLSGDYKIFNDGVNVTFQNI